MPVPTPEQLEKINKFALVPLTEDNCYVFEDLMIDDQPTAYYSKIHPNLLSKFMADANRGVGLLMNHNNRSLPVGRSFSADIREEYDEELGKTVKSVYGWFYIDLGRNTESGMTTDDIVKGIDAGTIFDTSIGFNANKWDCSICGNDIRDWKNCDHFPGEKYQVKDETGVFTEQTCYVIAGADGDGELLENSLVYAGACNRATIKKNFSVGDSVSEFEKGTKLHLVENFKNIPMDATIYQYYTKDGSVLFTDSSERTDGLEQLKKRSENAVEFAQFKAVLDKFSIKADTPEELSAAIEELQNLSAEVEMHKTKVTELESDLAAKTEELETVKSELTAKDEIITELTAINEDLTEKAELANTYRQDLTAKALELGVRAQGNAFNQEMYERFLGTLSIDEIKEVINGFEKEVEERFTGARISKGSDKSRKTRLSNPEPKSKDDFESEVEFRNYVAEEAVKYAKENNVSLKEATKAIYAKFTEGNEE